MDENSNSDKNYLLTPSSSSRSKHYKWHGGLPGGEDHRGQLIISESAMPDRFDRPERYHHHHIIIVLVSLCVLADPIHTYVCIYVYMYV